LLRNRPESGECRITLNSDPIGCGFSTVINLTVAPGDAWTDTAVATGGNPLAGPDPTKGVMLYSAQPYNVSGAEAFADNDSAVEMDKFQIKGENDLATSGDPGFSGIIGTNAGGIDTVFCISYNEIIATSPGSANIVCRGCDLYNSIIICAGITYEKAVYPPGVTAKIENTWVSGFANPSMYISAQGDPAAINNATDIPSSYVASDCLPSGPYGTPCAHQLPGSTGTCQGASCQGLAASNQFVSSTSPFNFQLKSTSALAATRLA